MATPEHHQPETVAKKESSLSHPEIEAVLKAHVVELEPHESGRRELLRSMGGVSLGALDVSIGRPIPPLNVESALLPRGKMKVLIGPNGGGKSTFFDALMERGAYFETKGGHGALSFGRPVHAREKLRIARLDQEELLGKINEFKAGEVLESAASYFKKEFPVNWGDSEAYEKNLMNQEAQMRIETLMDQITELFELREFWDRRVKELSGGERTKLALFMVLLSEPDAYLFDEPTNHLDLQSITKLISLFDRYKSGGAAIVNVSHVDWFLQDAGRDGVLEIVWDKKERALRESKKPYSSYIKNPTREHVPIISSDITWIQEGYEYKQGETVIETPYKFTIPQSPLKDFSFPTIQGGEVVILSGKNGTGKTKLIETFVRNLSDTLPKKRKGVQIGYLPQFWPEEIMKGTVGDFFDWIKAGTSPHSRGSSYHPESPAKKFFVTRAAQLTFGGSSRIGETWLRCRLRQLSSGEQRLLWFIAVSALRDVDVLVLDEPTNHMDKTLQERVATAIRNFPGAVIIATHDRNLLNTLSGDSRKPNHIILERRGDKTHVRPTKETPTGYIERIMREAKQQSWHLIT